MKKPKHLLPAWWRFLPDSDRDGVYDKITTFAWVVAFAIFTPTAYAALFDLTTNIALLVFIAVGAPIGIIGRIRHDLRIEIFGLILILLGFFVYIGVQLLFVQTGMFTRIPLSILAFFQFRHYAGRMKYLILKFIRNRYLAGDPVILFGRVLNGGLKAK